MQDQSTQSSVEIISIGTELLLGQILDTNTRFLTEELARIGLNCFWHTTVGDNKDRIKDVLKIAFDRACVLLTTGGLGPTVDDLTHECLAEFFGVPLRFDQSVMADIEEKFRKRRFAMPDSNRKQALRPEGADILPNPRGTAPGIIWRVPSELVAQAGISHPARARYVLTFPGVPFEMHGMWKDTACSFLVKTFGSGVIWSCDLKHYGIGESALAELHADLLDSANPTVAPLAGVGECRLRVTAKAATDEEARTIAAPVINKIREKSSYFCYGTDADTLESTVGDLLAEKGLSLAVAESCTGGLVSKRLTDIAGSSRYIKTNIVTYSNESKQQLLGVHEYILNTKGAVSAECAHAMATGIRRLAGSDIGLAVTGVAGPGGGTPEKPVGLVYVALVTEHCQADKELKFASDLARGEIRHRTANEVLNMVRLYLINPALLERSPQKPRA
jgi:nicotinamide-nucleotide amidase